MPLTHCLLAASVALMWGLNFLAIDFSLAQFPPFFLVALRFAVIAVPTLLLVPRPKRADGTRVPFRWIAGYGLGFGILQFLFLYWAMSSGMPAGLASLVLQASGPFTVLIGMTVLRERITGLQALFLLVATAGLAVVGWQRTGASAGLLPFLLTLAGAFGWAIGNICNRRSGTVEPIRLTLWMSVIPPLPMLALALLVEGPATIADSFSGLGTATGLLALAGLAYTVLVGTVVGSGVWSWLMTRNPAGVVAPFSMLVPVVGMSAAWLVLGETVSAGELCGAGLVVLGVLGAGWFAGRGRTLPPRRHPLPTAPAVEESVGMH